MKTGDRLVEEQRKVYYISSTPLNGWWWSS